MSIEISRKIKNPLFHKLCASLRAKRGNPFKVNNLFTIISLLFLIISNKSFASNFERKLLANDIIDSVLRHYPLILAQYEELSASQGRYIVADGVFGIQLKQEYLDYSRGFYDGKNLNTFFEKQNEFLGSKFYGGYRKSFGEFEDYKGGYETNNRGELFTRIEIPLLEGRSIDNFRLGKILAKYDIEESKVHLQKIKIQTKKDAIKAYWNWISSYQIYKTYDEIYKLSLVRDSQLKTRLQKGDISEIVYIENKKNLLGRKNQAIEAKNLFEISAIYLSLFYRDENSKPIIVDENQIPSIDFNVEKSFGEAKFKEDVQFALKNRAEIQILKIKKNAEEQNLKYAKNLLQPKLDLSVEASKDYGEGSATRERSRNEVGLKLTIPFVFGDGRGKKLESTSKINVLKQELELAENTINFELSQLRRNIDNSLEILNNAKEEVALAKKLEISEEKKFKLGDSNFFLVNFRESIWADSKIKQIITLQNYQNYLAEYEAKVFRLD